MRIVKQTLVIYSFLSFFTVLDGFSQGKGKIEFEVSEYDFGKVKEEAGPVTYEFEFTNTGSAPLVISKVKASCGCTTPSWTKEPVMPGEKGSIVAKYNPRNRPGNFRKSLTVTHNGEAVTTRVYIKGQVLPRVKTIEEQLPRAIGQLRFKTQSINFGKITDEKPVTKTVEMYNDGPDTLTFSGDYDAPAHIKVEFPEVLPPKTKAKVNVTYDAQKKADLGYHNEGVAFYTNEVTKNAKRFNIVATISEYFPPLTEEEKEKAPKLLITERMKDLGNVNQGVVKSENYVIRNGGKSKLQIRKVESNCNCIQTKMSDMVIKPGSTATLEVKFDSSGRRGRQTKTITIYSNDPMDPTQVATITAWVVSGD